MSNTQATIYIESFDQTQDLEALGRVLYRPDEEAPTTDVVLRVNVPAVNARAAFQFLSNGRDTTEESAIARYVSQFDRIYSFNTQVVLSAGNIDFSYSSTGSYERSSILPEFPFVPATGGTGFSHLIDGHIAYTTQDNTNKWLYNSYDDTDLKEYLYYLESSAPGARLDFVQQLAKEVFGSINAVDLFSNEDDIARGYEQAILKCGWKVNNFQTARLQLVRDQVNQFQNANAGNPVTTYYTGDTDGTFILEDPGHVFYSSTGTDTNDDDTNYTDHSIENINKLFYDCRSRKRFGYGAKFKVVLSGGKCKSITVENPGSGYAANDVIEFKLQDLSSAVDNFNLTMWGNYIKTSDGTAVTEAANFAGSLKILISQTSLPYVNGNIIGMFNKRDKFSQRDPSYAAYTGADVTDPVKDNPYNVTGWGSSDFEYLGKFSYKGNDAIATGKLGFLVGDATTIWFNKDSQSALKLAGNDALSSYELLQRLGLGAGEVIDYEDDTNDTNLYLYPVYYNYFAPEDIQALGSKINMSNVHTLIGAVGTGSDIKNGTVIAVHGVTTYSTSATAGNVNTFLYTKYLYNPNGKIQGGTFLVSDNGNTTNAQSGSGAVFEITFQKCTDGPTYIKSVIVKSPGKGYITGDVIRFPGTSFMLNTDTNLQNNYPNSASGSTTDVGNTIVKTSDDVFLIIGALDLPYLNLLQTDVKWPTTDETFALTSMEGAKGAQDVLTGLLSQVPARFNLPAHSTYVGSTTSGTYTDLTGKLYRAGVDTSSSVVAATFEVSFNDTNGADGNPDSNNDTNGMTNITVKTPGAKYQNGDVIIITGSAQTNDPQKFNGTITIKVEDWLLGMLNAPFTRASGTNEPRYAITNDDAKGQKKYESLYWQKEVTAKLYEGSFSSGGYTGAGGGLDLVENRSYTDPTGQAATAPVTDCRVIVTSTNGVVSIKLAKAGKNWHPHASNQNYLVISGTEIVELTDPTKNAGSNLVPNGVQGEDDIYIVLEPEDYPFINGVNFVSQPLYAGDKLQMIFTILSNKDQVDASGDYIAVARTALIEIFLTGDDHLFYDGTTLGATELQYLINKRDGILYDGRDISQSQDNYRLAHIGYDTAATTAAVFTQYPPLNRPGTDTNDLNDPYSSTFETSNARGAVP